MGAVALVLGLLSLFSPALSIIMAYAADEPVVFLIGLGVGIVFSIVGISLGAAGIRNSSTKGAAIAGMVISIITLVIQFLIAFFVIIAAVFFNAML